MKYNAIKLSKDLKARLKGMSLAEAHLVTGISAPTLSRLTNLGKPDIITYGLVCKFIGVSLDTYIK